MSAQRLVGLSVLLGVVAACAPNGAGTAPRPIVPENGPKGSIYASYSGGLVSRTVSASFRVDQDAFVIVGHLGGDGVIRVLYPSVPIQAFRRVRADQSVAVSPFPATFDGVPTLFSLARSPFRTAGSMMDSYDGRGHGYIFMIASHSPLDVTRISDGVEWDEIDVHNYLQTTDPRASIRELADELADGSRYTIKFANSFTTQAHTSFASNMADCSLLSTLGYGHLGNFWGSWGSGGLWFLGYGGSPYSGLSSCNRNRYYAYGDFGIRNEYLNRRTYSAPRFPQPTGPITPTLTRPTGASRSASGGGLAGRSILDRPEPRTRNSALDRTGSISPRDRARESSARGSGIARRSPNRDAGDARQVSERNGRVSDPPSGRAASPRSEPQRSAGSERSAPPPRATAPAPPQRTTPPARVVDKPTAEKPTPERQ